MGAERAELVVGLQAALLRAAGDFGTDPHFAPFESRVLATAAALDYVLMLATESAGVRIPKRDAERAIHEGIERAVDDLIAVASAIARIDTPLAVAFARSAAKTLQVALRHEHLSNDARAFALIALANA